MRSIFRATEMDHTIETCEGCASTVTSMCIEFLLGENVATVLSQKAEVVSVRPRRRSSIEWIVFLVGLPHKRTRP